MRLKICHLYADLLDLYGDRGNITVLAQRAAQRNIDVEIGYITLGEQTDFRDWDILFIGGGSDREQGILFKDLCRRRENLAIAVEEGLVVLAICGGLQLMGKYYQTANGEKIPGVEILDLWTLAGKRRLIGNVCLEVDFLQSQAYSEHFSKIKTLVGFENHSGQTFLGSAQPLGKVISGNGNNGGDNLEGVVYRNVYGTYLHGPLLPKNPHLADHLLGLAIQRRWNSSNLIPLDDSLELAAHNYMVNRLGNKK